MGLLHVIGNGASIQLEGIGRAYLEYYPDTIGAGRKAYIGFTSDDSAELTIKNQYASGGNIVLSPGANGNVIVNNGNVNMGYEKVTDTLEIQHPSNELIINCPTGKKVLGGGCSSGDTILISSNPTANNNGWYCKWDRSLAPATAYAICARIT
ncbi:MAG: hypothetical protein ABH864_03130 [archaeon]